MVTGKKPVVCNDLQEISPSVLTQTIHVKAVTTTAGACVR